jgi:hypothetical protein
LRQPFEARSPEHRNRRGRRVGLKMTEARVSIVLHLPQVSSGTEQQNHPDQNAHQQIAARHYFGVKSYLNLRYFRRVQF